MDSTAGTRGKQTKLWVKLLSGSALAIGLTASGAAAAASGGGINAPSPPTVKDVSCESACAGMREAAPDSVVRFTGRNLEYVAEVRFDARGGGRTTVAAKGAEPRSVNAEVPADAVTGKPKLVDAGGQVAKSPVELEVVDEEEIAANAGGGVGDVTASPAKGFFAGKRRATASFMPKGDGPQDVRVEVIDHSSGDVVKSIAAEGLEPHSPAKVRWNGKTDSGKVARNGEYDFDVRPMSGGQIAEASFEQYDHIFPIRGQTQFGDGLGAGRGHRGTDAFADCGTRLVAARGGKVKTKAYQGSGAGNYLVIDGKGTNVDYVYMHMREPAKVAEGDRVKTGQTIGRVGETGNASGCHLHFEMWKGGWYDGGKPINSLSALRKWDDWS